MRRTHNLCKTIKNSQMRQQRQRALCIKLALAGVLLASEYLLHLLINRVNFIRENVNFPDTDFHFLQTPAVDLKLAHYFFGFVACLQLSVTVYILVVSQKPFALLSKLFDGSVVVGDLLTDTLRCLRHFKFQVSFELNQI